MLVAAAMTVAVVTGGAAASAAAGPNAGSPRDATARSLGAGARNVASILRPDGSVRTEAAGSFSVKGYRMAFAPNGAPRFLPGDQAAASGRTVPDPNWDDRFGEPGVQNGDFPNGVNAIAVDGNDVYVGGLFNYAGGAPFAQVVRWDGDSWHELSGGITGAPSDQDPEVDALVLSGTTLYVGGIFDQVKNGGAAVPASNVAAYDTQTDTWSALGTGITLGSCGLFCTGQVKALAVSGSTLFAAGSFGHAGTVDVNSIAKWNGTAWSALGRGLYSCADCPDNPGDVRALQVSGSTLYAGGSFSEAGTEDVSNIAQWNIGSSTWSAMGDGVGGFFGGVVDALAMHGSNLVVGGDFTQAGTTDVNSLAQWTGSAWQALAGDNSGVQSSGSEGEVDSLLVSGSTLFVGGYFDEVLPGATATKGGLASLDLGSHAWTVLPVAELPSTVDAFAVNPDGGVYVGGSFETGGPLATALFLDDIGVLNGSTWSTLGQGVTSGENGRGFGLALAHGPDGEYVGGSFDQVGPVQTRGIARWDGSAWHGMGKGIAGSSSVAGPMVFAIAVAGGQVFIGGDFSSVSGVTAHNIAVFSGGAWHAVAKGTNGIVQALAPSNGYLYVGGDFTMAGGKATGAPAARWKLGTALGSTAGWTKLGPLFGAGGVASIAFDGPWVFLGGDLSHCEPGAFCDHGGTSTNTAPCETVSGYSINGLVMWNVTKPNTWFAPFGCGVTVGAAKAASPGDVTSMRRIGTKLYVGGFFDHAGILHRSPNQVAARNVAALDLSVLNQTKTRWSALSAGVGSASADIVWSLSSVGKTLYVAGSFTKVNGVTRVGIAQWNSQTSAWSGLGSGLGCPTDDCTAEDGNAVDGTANGVYVAGNFGTAGGTGSENFARWQPPSA